MAIYFPAFLQATRTPHVASHLDDFTRGVVSAFEHRSFSFSSFTASIFFEPSSAEHVAFTNLIYNGFETTSLNDLLDSVMVSLEDVASRRMPSWARDDVLPYAQHFTRSSGVTYAPFVTSLQHRLFASATVQKMLAESPRGPTGTNDLRNMLHAFASLVLLTKALTQTNTHTHTPIMSAYLQRVIERFHVETCPEFELNFNGPTNPVWMLDGQSLYEPVRPAAKEVRQDLSKIVVAAYRALTCSNAPARDILSWTQLALNSFHTHPTSMWAASSRAFVAVAPKPTVAATTSTSTSTTATATFLPVRTPKTPSTPKTPKNTLRFETAIDNF